ncbi:inositol-tetrakisphosphate 1-kinase-like [Odontomachus brunneus]|uniref:inositol-tetrakisphosphate 1-kinase-like n=1 Tax=Odontomachus brunneus TaxID=486640 RepID=UPI0013F23F5D|nr:inositol-tetrakisphosphate 1-kinase-like [Odontomachus brunneus]XP_032687340.1 inositol-tetrakisphosphate 1-kinase-like [Odontomachus brunneus]
MCDKYVIGYWISERKRQKFNWNDFENVCESEGFRLKMIDVNLSLEKQGPLHVFLHKLTDTQSHAESGDKNAEDIVTRLQEYIAKHPDLIVIDPLDNIKNLRNRCKSYEFIQEGIRFSDIFTPNFVEIKSRDVQDIVSTLKKRGIKYPFVCKPLIAYGFSDAHKMMIIFNERDLKDCQPPCVAQDFINHNAILYKVFVVGERFHVVERPSLKNFYQEDCNSLSTIFFDSHDISKSGSKSKWSILSEEDIPLTMKPNYQVFETIVKSIKKIFGLTLVGVDVVIENHTGKYAIIDVNVFPGYDGYPNFFEHLIDSIRKLLVEQGAYRQSSKSCTLKKCQSDDLDSGFESDEKRKCSTK